MKTFGKFIFMISSLSLLVLLMLVSIAMAVTYEYTTIDFPGASFTEAYGINDSDQIVGEYISGGISHGFLYDGSNFETIDFPSAYATEAFDINNKGQIVGNYYLGGISHGFLYDGNSFKTINFPSAHGINDAGQIVGTYSSGDNAHGFLFDGSSFRTIDFPGAHSTLASGINDAGQITGIYKLSLYGFFTPSFLYDGNSFKTINISGTDFTQAFGINNSSQIVGMYSFDVSHNRYGFLYDDNIFWTIAFPGTSLTEANGINDAGQIVGSYSDGYGTHGFVATPTLPKHFDWRDQTSLPSVKSQALCGSCWAFSAVGAVEGSYSAKNNTLIDLSEQNLVSNCGCTGSCNGGWHYKALNYIKEKGIVDENCFPYQSWFCKLFDICMPWCSCYSECSMPCSCDRCDNWPDRLFQISDYDKVPNKIKDIKKALIRYGPLSVCSNEWKHCIVLIGYDDSAVKGYDINNDGTIDTWYTGLWIIRNSWGSGWENEGYGTIPYGGHKYSDIINNAYYVLFN